MPMEGQHNVFYLEHDIDHKQWCDDTLYPSQLPSLTGAESSTDSYSVSIDELPTQDLEHNPTTYIAFVLSAIGCVVVYPIIAENIKIDEKKGSTASKKPKAYYQFWGAHVVILTLLIYTFRSVNLNITPSIGGIFAAYIVSTIFNYFYIFGGDKLNTPTQSCICHWFCKKGCSIVVTIISLFMVALFVSLCIIILPTVIFIYYLYPAHTLIRMPFIINSILYINSLLALLLFQCERLCFILVKFISERLNCIRCI